jgi:hypothetical protein
MSLDIVQMSPVASYLQSGIQRTEFNVKTAGEKLSTPGEGVLNGISFSQSAKKRNRFIDERIKTE